VVSDPSGPEKRYHTTMAETHIDLDHGVSYVGTICYGLHHIASIGMSLENVVLVSHSDELHTSLLCVGTTHNRRSICHLRLSCVPVGI
jgi:hypothetical protein